MSTIVALVVVLPVLGARLALAFRRIALVRDTITVGVLLALTTLAAVLALLAAGGPAGEPPIADRTGAADGANPLPQALALTAIVISFGLTVYLLALARREHALTGDDLVEDDLEDQRVGEVRGSHEWGDGT